MRSIMPVARAATLPGAPSEAVSGGSVRSRTRTSAREPATLTPTQLSSGTARITWFFMASASQAGQKEPLSTPQSARARRISH